MAISGLYAWLANEVRQRSLANEDMEFKLVESFADEMINIYRFVIFASKGKESVKIAVVLMDNQIIGSEFAMFKLFCQNLIMKSELQWNFVFVNLDEKIRTENFTRLLDETVQSFNN